MAKQHDDYKKLDRPTEKMEPCPCCGSDVELWQYSVSDTAPTNKVVMCSFGDAFGPQDGIANEGCPMYMPPEGHYKATAREAIKFWNEWAKTLQAIQRANRWARYSALRATPTRGLVGGTDHG